MSPAEKPAEDDAKRALLGFSLRTNGELHPTCGFPPYDRTALQYPLDASRALRCWCSEIVWWGRSFDVRSLHLVFGSWATTSFCCFDLKLWLPHGHNDSLSTNLDIVFGSLSLQVPRPKLRSMLRHINEDFYYAIKYVEPLILYFYFWYFRGQLRVFPFKQYGCWDPRFCIVVKANGQLKLY